MVMEYLRLFSCIHTITCEVEVFWVDYPFAHLLISLAYFSNWVTFFFLIYKNKQNNLVLIFLSFIIAYEFSKYLVTFLILYFILFNRFLKFWINISILWFMRFFAYLIVLYCDFPKTLWNFISHIYGFNLLLIIFCIWCEVAK
jgi:hypothetical protein